jgi:CheY-like chemotaxis protein
MNKIRMNKINLKVLVFLLTSKDMEQALSRGMDGHLSKPIDIDACLRAIAESITCENL